MKFLIYFCCVLIFTTCVSFTEAAATKPKCHDKNTNHYWDVGTEYRPVGQCVKYECKDNGVKQAITCPLNQAGSGCTKVDGNLRKQYPDCCPTFNCKRS
ncbi:venom peptide HsVx1-like [Condylostylus longicornis]|uniref:venom peptide HsVx1-like n=1 Tax=Condylostylus longicornis TaxID=2530218 RepID=UPI00244DA93C|nr:venom peptide HsVx1-like [Condylostylus longicornis]